MTRVGEKLLHQFGVNIAQIRKSKGLTQQQLAEVLNMSVVSVAYIETGKRWVRPSTLVKISRALDTEPYKLFK